LQNSSAGLPETWRYHLHNGNLSFARWLDVGEIKVGGVVKMVKKVKAVLKVDTWEAYVNVCTAFWRNGKPLQKFAVVNGIVDTHERDLQSSFIKFYPATNRETIVFFGYNAETLVYCQLPKTPENMQKVETTVTEATFRI
jgi:hypothetical protein